MLLSTKHEQPLRLVVFRYVFHVLTIFCFSIFLFDKIAKLHTDSMDTQWSLKAELQRLAIEIHPNLEHSIYTSHQAESITHVPEPY